MFAEIEGWIKEFPSVVIAAGGVQESLILKVQEILHVNFPWSVAEYLRRFGYVSVAAGEFVGLERQVSAPLQPLVAHIADLRSNWDLPWNYLPVFADEEFEYVLELSNDRAEGPVRSWIVGIAPDDQATHGGLEQIAADFPSFLVAEIGLQLRAFLIAKGHHEGALGIKEDPR